MTEFELVWYLNTYFQGEQQTIVKTILRKENNGKYMPIPKEQIMHVYRGYGSWLRHCRPNQFKQAYEAHRGLTLPQALNNIPKKQKLNRGHL